MPTLMEIADSIYYSKCARCQYVASESDEYCPSCQYFLGETCEYSRNPQSALLPPTLSEYSFVVFQCSYLGSTGCTFVGQGPVVVAQTNMNIPESFEVIDSQNYDENIAAFGDSALPQPGDVLIAVNDICVTHLSHGQFSRLAKRIRLRCPRDALRLTFRRYHQSIVDIKVSLSRAVAVFSILSMCQYRDKRRTWALRLFNQYRLNPQLLRWIRMTILAWR